MHAIMIPYDMIHKLYVCTGARQGQRLERAANMIIIFIAINKNLYSHTEWHIRKYGSTFYIGIAMVVFPYIGPWKN